jgi:hypothetical protein
MIAEISIPDIWSLRACLSVIGIIYFCICLSMFSKGVLKGVTINCGLLTVGFILLYILTPKPVGFDGPKDGWKYLEPRVFNDEGHSVDLKSLMNVRVIPRIYSKENDRLAGYHIDYEVYAMHDPQSPDYLCSPWIFHPASLVYCPGIFSLPVIVIGSLISKKL